MLYLFPDDKSKAAAAGKLAATALHCFIAEA